MGTTTGAGSWLALPAAWVVWLAVFVSVGFQGFNLFEDAWLLTLAERVLRGEVPYRDFSYHRPPLPVYLQAALRAWVPGYAVPESRWYFATEVGLILGAVYALLGRIEPNRWVRAFYAVAAVLFAFTRGFPALPLHRVDGLVFTAAATVALVAAVERRAPAWAFGAGVAAAVAALCEQGFAVVPLVGLGLVLAAPGRRIGDRPWRGAAAYMAGGAVVAVATAIHLVHQRALGAFVESVLLAPRETTREVLGYDLWTLLVGLQLPSLAGAVGGLALLAVVTARVSSVLRLALGAASLAGFVAAFWLRPSNIHFVRVAVLEPVFTSVWVGGLTLLAGCALGCVRLSPPVLVALVLGLGTLYASGWSYVGIWMAGLGLALPLPMVFLMLAGSTPAASPQPEAAGGRDLRARRFGADCVMLGAAVIAVGIHVAAPYLDASRGELVVPFTADRLRGIRSSALRVRGVDGVVALIQREAARGDYVLSFMDFPGLYFVADRPNPTRVDWFRPQELTAADVRRVVADLEARPPRLVILNSLDAWQMSGHSRLRPILGHILEHYEKGEAIGEFLVFRPRRR